MIWSIMANEDEEEEDEFEMSFIHHAALKMKTWSCWSTSTYLPALIAPWWIPRSRTNDQLITTTGVIDRLLWSLLWLGSTEIFKQSFSGRGWRPQETIDRLHRPSRWCRRPAESRNSHTNKEVNTVFPPLLHQAADRTDQYVCSMEAGR